MKKVLWIFIVVVLCFFGAGSVSAVTYQGEVNVRFTFNDVLSLTVDDELIDVGTLLPGSSAVSNPITLTVNTNYLYGYKLLATVGDTTHDYRELMREDGEQSFVSLAVDSDVATLPDGDSVWGYAKSVDGGTTWSNYSGLPKYDSNAKLLNSSTGAAMNATTNFRVGAKVKDTQAPGTYSNVVNFVLLTNPSKIYLQDVTPEQCTAEESIAYDRRDEKEYGMIRVHDVCWITKNLQLDLVATSLEQLQGDTNASNETLNYLKNAGGRSLATYGTTTFYGNGPVAKFSGSKSYSVPLFYDESADVLTSGNGYIGESGYYYNYCAATAGSFCYGEGNQSGSWPNTNYPSASEDICPSGWRLPTADEFIAVFSVWGPEPDRYNSIATENAIHMPRAGQYTGTKVDSFNNYGYFWSSNLATTASAKVLKTNVSRWDVNTGFYRSNGLSVRCILNES